MPIEIDLEEHKEQIEDALGLVEHDWWEHFIDRARLFGCAEAVAEFERELLERAGVPAHRRN